VEVADLTTETAQTFANENGSFTLEQRLTPQRVRRGNGWTPIDTTLRFAADGSVQPGATTTDLRFSAGGTAPLASIGKSGKELALSWSAALPKPTLAGDTATYAEVLPGVDLRVTAEADGFSEVLVVKTRAAAKNPALAGVTFKTTTRGLDLHRRADGNIEAKDGSGQALFSSRDATMWDSPTPVSAATAKALARVGLTPPGFGDTDRPHRTVKMPTKLGKGSLTVVPDAGVLTAADTVYPVYIDPSFSENKTSYTIVNKAAPTASYYDSAYRDSMRVGRQWDSTNTWRSFFQFDTTALIKTQVLSASLFLTLDHSASCSATPVQLYSSKKVTSWTSMTWNSTTSSMLSLIQTKSMNANESSCPQPDYQAEFGASGVLSLVKKNAAAGATRTAFALRAQNESDENQWKKFYETASKSWLSATYNRTPAKPTSLSISNCYVACGNPATVNSGEPTLKATVSDPDGGTLTAKFEVARSDTDALVRSGSVTGVASGKAATWKITPVIVTQSDYEWRVRACDSHGVCGPFTGWFGFSTDTTKPAAPAVTPVDAALYFEDDGDGTASGGIGLTGKLKLGPNGAKDVVNYVWSLDGGPNTTVSTLATDLTAVITVKPLADMIRTLTVTSHDKAGQASSKRSYKFNVTSPEPEAGVWLLDEPAGATVAANDLGIDDDGTVHPEYLNGTVSAGVTFGTAPRAGAAGTAATFDGTNGRITTVGSPVLVTDGSAARSFSVAAWVNLTDTTVNRVAVSQDGVNVSMFRLGYVSTGHWCFTVRGSDDTAATSTRVCVSAAGQANTWVHLAGVYDAVGKKIYLYVNAAAASGSVAPSIAYTTPWQAVSSFAIGRSENGAGTRAEQWKGAIDDVRAYQRVLPLEEIQSLWLS
jgi:hypothetical protein